MGTVALPEMKQRRYDSALATGCLALGGTLGSMIPPSTGFVIYGIIAEQSIGRLFIAGIIPGVLLALLYIGVVYVIRKRNPLAGAPGRKTTFKEKISSLKGIWIVMLLFALVMGGIYLGKFSATEAAAVGAFGAFVFAVATRRLSFKSFKSSINTTMRNTAMGFLIICGAMIFNYFLAVTRLPTQLASFVHGMSLSPYWFIVALVILYFILGTAMDGIAMTLLTVPLFLPLVEGYGFSLIWFGVFVVLMAEIASASPPVGITVFVVQSIAQDVPMWTVFRGVWPFMGAQMVMALLLLVFPALATFLPSTMF
jgi:C4-dicarboxylate transporter, DctM subunit